MDWSKLDEPLADKLSNPRFFIHQLVLPSEQLDVVVHLENETHSAKLTGNAVWELTDQPWVRRITLERLT